MEFGFKIPESWLKTFIGIITSPMCGSGYIKSRIHDTQKLQLIETYQAPHVFMVTDDGLFNQGYVDTRNWFDGFTSGEIGWLGASDVKITKILVQIGCKSKKNKPKLVR